MYDSFPSLETPNIEKENEFTFLFPLLLTIWIQKMEKKKNINKRLSTDVIEDPELTKT